MLVLATRQRRPQQRGDAAEARRIRLETVMDSPLHLIPDNMKAVDELPLEREERDEERQR